MIYMVHKHRNWNKEFGSSVLLLQYLDEHQVTRRQLHDYLIIEGIGAWQMIAEDLPPGPKPTMVEGDPIESDPF